MSKSAKLMNIVKLKSPAKYMKGFDLWDAEKWKSANTEKKHILDNTVTVMVPDSGQAGAATWGFKDTDLIDSIRLGLTSTLQAHQHCLSWQGNL